MRRSSRSSSSEGFRGKGIGNGAKSCASTRILFRTARIRNILCTKYLSFSDWIVEQCYLVLCTVHNFCRTRAAIQLGTRDEAHRLVCVHESLSRLYSTSMFSPERQNAEHFELDEPTRRKRPIYNAWSCRHSSESSRGDPLLGLLIFSCTASFLLYSCTVYSSAGQPILECTRS